MSKIRVGIPNCIVILFEQIEAVSPILNNLETFRTRK